MCIRDRYLYSGHWLEVAGVKVTSVDTAHDYLVAAMRVGEEDGTVVRWTDRPRMWMLAKDNATVLREAAEVVYAELGGGYPESVYEDAIAILLREQRIQHNRQFAVDFGTAAESHSVLKLLKVTVSSSRASYSSFSVMS